VLRNSLPRKLYIADKPAENESSVLVPNPFSWGNFTKVVLEAHLNNPSHSSPFISAYSDFATTCRQIPQHTSSCTDSASSTTVLTIDTKHLVPAWSVLSGTHFPIWIEQGHLPKIPHGVLTLSHEGYESFASSAWICVEEARYTLGLECREIEGEWLACGTVPERMVVRRERVVVLREMKGNDELGTVVEKGEFSFLEGDHNLHGS
jgi:hypothetical protein